MKTSQDFERRIADAARRRAAANTEQSSGPAGARRVSGYEKQLQEARAARQEILAERAEQRERDLTQGEATQEDGHPHPHPAQEDARKRLETIGASLSLSELRPAPSREFVLKTAERKEAETTPVAEVATFGKFSTGLAAGLTLCAGILVAATYVTRDAGGPLANHGAAPEVTVGLAEFRVPEAPQETGSLSPVGDAGAAGSVSRSAINPLQSPLPLADVPRHASLSPDTVAPAYAAEMPGAAVPVPLGLEPRSTEMTRTAWAQPALDASRPGLATARTDARPLIDTAAVAPDFRAVDIALTSPASGTAPAVAEFGAHDPVEMAALRLGVPDSARPAGVTRDEAPTVAGVSDGAPVASAQLPAMGLQRPDAEAAFDIGLSEEGRPDRMSRGPQLAGLDPGDAPALDPSLSRADRSVPRPELDAVSLPMPSQDLPAVTRPQADRPVDRPNGSTSLAALSTELPFDPSAGQPAAAPPTAVRAVLTVSAERAKDLDGLDALDVDIAAVQITSFSVDRTRVHYFHAEDEDAAERMARRLGGETIDMTGVVPSPPAGTLEIQLSD